MGKIQFIDERCFGCGACWSIAPENFTCSDTGHTVMINDEVNDKAIEASEICPASAIIIEKNCNCNDCDCDECDCDECDCDECDCENCDCENEHNCSCGDNCNCDENCTCGCQD